MCPIEALLTHSSVMITCTLGNGPEDNGQSGGTLARKLFAPLAWCCGSAPLARCSTFSIYLSLYFSDF